MPYGTRILESVATGWLERADIPLVLITDTLRLVWLNAAAGKLMERLSLKVNAFGQVKSSDKDIEAKAKGVRRQVLAAIADRPSWRRGTVFLPIDAVPGARLQLYELPAEGAALIGCAILLEDDSVRDFSARLSQYGLTNTERKIVSMLAGGATASEIARANGSSLLTVRTHIKRVYEKMDVNSREKMFARLTSRTFTPPSGRASH